MGKVSEQKINDLTRKHISRVFLKVGKDFEVPGWLKQIIKTEFWLLNQNIKSLLYSSDSIDLDVKDRPWIPNMPKKANSCENSGD